MGSENLTIYKASAGSGKTYRLAYEFIKHILGRRDNTTGRYSLVTSQGVGANRHRSILAITFTNKATEEMKRRIVRELAVLAGAPLVRHRKSDYRTRLINEFRCTPDQLAQCASTALTNLLFDFNFFNVSTIDAFFQTVLRVFAHEAELSGNYEVEIADRYAIESGVNELFNRVIRDADRQSDDSDASDSRRLIHWLNTYMMSQINNGKSFSIFNRNSQLRAGLISFFTSLTGEDFKYHEQELMAYINRPELLLQFEQKLMQRRTALAAEIKADAAAVIETLDTTQGFTSRSLVAGLMPALRQFAAGSFKLPATVTRANTTDEPECRFAAKPLREGLVTPQLDAMVKATLEKSFEYAELDMIARQIYNFGLFGRVMREISQYRRDNNLILLSDTNSLLREIIGENSTPFVYERVGLWLRHFLIDEFQDTSGLQWDNLRPLVANSIAESNDNLIIGDEKQCIYRFRNSDPTLLQSRVSREFAGRVRLEGNTSASNTNYRSSGTVVEFNNMLFSALSLRFGLTSLYANVRQDVHQTELPGYVAIKALTGSNLDGSFKTNAVQNMINEIARQLNSGYRQSDIAILVRSNSEADFVISQTLEQAKDHPELQTLQFLSDDALTIGTNTSVQQIVNRLHSLNRPAGASLSDKYTTPEQFAAIIRETDRLQTAGMSRSEATVQAIKAYHDGTLPLTPNHGEQNNVFHSLFNTVEELIAEHPEDARRRDTVYLSAFQDEVLDFMSRGQADLYSFLRWWDSRKDKAALASAPGLDAIRIMTIHKSKGLEFPCVHIPLLSGSLRSDRDTIRWYSTDGFNAFDKDIVPPMIPLASSSTLSVTSFADAYNKVLDDNLVDELNVLYVAFTRAVNELIVSYSAPASSKDPYSIGAVLKAVLGNDGDYTSGEPTSKLSSTDNDASQTPDEPRSIDMATYKSGIRTGLTALAVCDELPDTDSPRYKGNLLHRVLADVHHRSELPLVVRRLAARGIVPRGQAASITDSLMKATSDERVRQWFEGYEYVANETTIHVPGDENETENRRPDRIVVHGDGSIDVIDYKFGEVHTAAYHRQVAHYMQLLERIYPSKKIRGYIWYIPSGHIDCVDA